MANEATIEIRSRKVDIIGEATGAQHLFIICTNSNGKEKIIIRGGTGTNDKIAMLKDNIHIVKAPYQKQYEHLFPGDHDPEVYHSKIIFTGTDEQMQGYMDRMWDIGQKINQAHFDYKLPVGHIQNSNTVVRVLVEKAGLEFKLPEVKGAKVWAPGIDGDLKHTDFDRKLSFWLDTVDSYRSPGAGFKAGAHSPIFKSFFRHRLMDLAIHAQARSLKTI